MYSIHSFDLNSKGFQGSNLSAPVRPGGWICSFLGCKFRAENQLGTEYDYYLDRVGLVNFPPKTAEDGGRWRKILSSYIITRAILIFAIFFCTLFRR